MRSNPIGTVAALLLLIITIVAGLPATSSANTITPGFTVGGYTLVSKVRSTRTAYDMTFSVSITNSTGRGALNVAATLASVNPSVTIIDNSVSFGSVGSGTDVNGSDTFTIRVASSYNVNESDLRWTVSYTPANQPPVIQPIAAISVNKGDTVTITPVVSDPDGDSFTVSYSGWMSTNTRITNYMDAGTHIVTVTATDSLGAKTMQDISVTVGNINRSPTLQPIAAINILAGDSFTISPVAFDPDNDPLTVSFSDWMDTSGKTTTESDLGSHIVTVTVSDGFGGEVIQAVAVTVSKITTVDNITIDPLNDTHYEAPADSAVAGLVLDIPAGALPTGNSLEVGYVESPPGHSNIEGGFGKVYYIGPKGTVFNTPINISIRYNPADLDSTTIISEDVLKLYSFTEGDSDWHQVQGSIVDRSSSVVSGATTHLSYYGINGDRLYSERACWKAYSKSCTELTKKERNEIGNKNDSSSIHGSNFYPVLLVHGIYGDLGTFGETATLLGSIAGDSVTYTDSNNIDAWYFVYDTNDDMRASGYSMRNAISKIKSMTASNAVNIVSHSMGGLVSRAYLQNYALLTSDAGYIVNNNDVRKLLTMGTPHNGSNFGISACAYNSTAGCQMIPGSNFLDWINSPEKYDTINIKHELPSDIVYRSLYGSILEVKPFDSNFSYADNDCVVKNDSAAWGLGSGYHFTSQHILGYSHSKQPLPGCNSPSLVEVDNSQHTGYQEILSFVTADDAKKPISPVPVQGFKLPDTGQTKCYQVDFPYSEILCTGTGQDGAYDINSMSFTDNGNGTVTDNNTGLMWQKCSIGQSNDASCSGTATTLNWYRASGTYAAVYNPSSVSVCGSLSLGDYSDWRLPSKKELMGIIDYSIPYPGPTIRLANFPHTVVRSLYWSSTTYANGPGSAWYVSFGNGLVFGENKVISYYVRCVRGGL